jgi:hypothetical protein
MLIILSSCGVAGIDPYVSKVDQENTSPGIVAGIGTPVVQSFVPGQPTSTGADIRAHGTASLTGDYRISLFAAYDGRTGVSGLLASGEVYDVPRFTDAQVRWSPVEVNTGDTYYLYIELIGGAIQVGAVSSLTDEYTNGDALLGGGNMANVSDIYFVTYYAQF